MNIVSKTGFFFTAVMLGGGAGLLFAAGVAKVLPESVIGSGDGLVYFSLLTGIVLASGGMTWMMNSGGEGTQRDTDGFRETGSRENYRDQERRREIERLESRLSQLKQEPSTPGLEIERER
jgi:hypothetical protein